VHPFEASVWAQPRLCAQTDVSPCGPAVHLRPESGSASRGLVTTVCMVGDSYTNRRRGVYRCHGRCSNGCPHRERTEGGIDQDGDDQRSRSRSQLVTLNPTSRVVHSSTALGARSSERSGPPAPGSLQWTRRGEQASELPALTTVACCPQGRRSGLTPDPEGAS
jgi:hypothetical protein